MISSLKNFIHSLDPRSLPRILQIQCGFYDEDSVHERHNHECCLSTGDLIKIVGLKVTKLLATNSENDDASPCSTAVELPLNFPGLCKIVADKTPYANVEEIVKSVLIAPTQQPCFYCSKELQTENLTIKPGEMIRFSSVENSKEILTIHCGVIRDSQMHAFLLPLSQEGEFYECEDNRIYTLNEIAQWKIPKSRSRHVTFTNTCDTGDSTTFPHVDFGDLMPIYEVQAVMKFQKEIVHFLSDLDVEVKDVTDCYNINSFLQPLSVEDILERTSDDFPIVVAVSESSIENTQSCDLLRPGREVIIYKMCQERRILASEHKEASCKRHFLIPTSYKGKFKRKPRKFPTAYDLEIARDMKEKLHVLATKAFVSLNEDLCSVSVGDEFLIPQLRTNETSHLQKKIVEEALVCEQILLLNKTHKSVLLPMCLEGGFVELVHDKRQYDLSELCKDFSLPFNVKVSIRDLSIQEDILADIPCLQLEEEIIESFLLISTLNNPTEIWEIPTHRLNVSFQLLRNHIENTLIFPVKSVVEEITEEQYCMIRKYENRTTIPPPRPPKTHTSEEPKSSFLPVSAQSVHVTPRSQKSLSGDATKKWLSDQDTPPSELQLKRQSDLEKQQNEKDLAEIHTLPKGLSRSMLVRYEADKKPKAGSNSDDKDEKVIGRALKIKATQ
ncbi:protein THEMIS [Anolis carolinensis]|uniref:protein THEMIS n=1 Tax=Anolis carolinensis TaxID=28377 RepID=UPI002F2B45FE